MERPLYSTGADDFKTIVLLAVMLACLIALIALLFNDASVAESRMQPMLSAHAAMLHGAPAPAAAATSGDTAPTKPVTPEENWAADESSQGLRPDAAY